ncbi:MAG: glycosyltransferase family 4 protein [Verrucomicrobia bacterium]|nr:MAG: glycosyltransferase family 4 protein [Verrucomicrobiota bacterium]
MKIFFQAKILVATMRPIAASNQAKSFSKKSPSSQCNSSDKIPLAHLQKRIKLMAHENFCIKGKPQPSVEVQLEKPSIGFVRRGYSATGGAEAYLKRLAEGLLERGYRVLLLGTGEWPSELWPGGEVIVLPNSSLHFFSKAVLECKKKEKIDLLFSLERVPGVDIFRAGDGLHTAWLESRKKREHAWKSLLSSWMPRHREIVRMERELFSPQSATVVIANSAMVAQEIREHFSFPQQQLKVIPNGVPLFDPLSSKERDAAREVLGMKKGELALLFVGSGWKRKGVEVAIRAVEQLALEGKSDSKMQLWVAGKGPSHQYRSKVVHFLGPVKKMELLYAASDLFILPTLYDPFANATLEALVMGLPVITTSANGCSELIEEGVHGSVIQDPNNVQAFSVALAWWKKRLLSQEALQIRDACRKRGASFTMERNLNQTIEVMDEVLAKHLPEERSP